MPNICAWVFGRALAISSRVASENTTYGGTPRSRAISLRSARRRSKSDRSGSSTAGGTESTRSRLRVAGAACFGHAKHFACLCARALGLRFVFTGIREAVVGFDLRPRIEQHAIALQTIAPGSPELLIIALHRARHVVMHHEAHVRLVDAHAEGDGSDDHVDLVVLEGVLHFRSHARVEPSVVVTGAHAVFLQILGGGLDGFARQTIDDATLPRPAARNGERCFFGSAAQRVSLRVGMKTQVFAEK